MPSPLRAASGTAASTSSAAAPIGRRARAPPSRPSPSHARRQGPVRGCHATRASPDGLSAAVTMPWWRRSGGDADQQVTRGVEAGAVVPPAPPPAAAAASHRLLTPLAGAAAAALAVRAVVAANLASGPAAAAAAAAAAPAAATAPAAVGDPDAAKRAALAKELAVAAARPGGPRPTTALRRGPGFSTALLATRASVALTRAIQAAEFGDTAGAMAELDAALRTHGAARGGTPLPSGAGPADTARLYVLFLQNTELPADYGALLALRDLLHMSGPDAEALEAEVLTSGADFSI